MTNWTEPEALGNNGKGELCRPLGGDPRGKEEFALCVLIPEDLTQRDGSWSFVQTQLPSDPLPLPSGS